MFSSALVSEMRFGFARGNFFQTPPNFGSGCPEQLIGLKGAPTDESICGGIPVMDFPGGNLQRIGRTTSVPQFQTPSSYNFRDSFARTHGSHERSSVERCCTFRRGFATSALFWASSILPAASAALERTCPFKAVRQTCCWGSQPVTSKTQTPSSISARKCTSLYAQDDWKVSTRTDTEYGLRYEFARHRASATSNGPISIPAHVITYRRRKVVFLVNLSFTRTTTISLHASDLLMPPSGTVVRGAYGVFYNHTNRQGREGLLGFNYPLSFCATTDRRKRNLKITDAIFRLQDGIPAGFMDPSRVNPATRLQGAGPGPAHATYVQQWNFGIQQELVTNLLLDVAYVGNKGTKLAAFRNLNQRAVSFNSVGQPWRALRPLAGVGLDGDIQFLENLGVSNYHSHASASGKALLQRTVRAGFLHLGQGPDEFS